jgi:hypothetical protein
MFPHYTSSDFQTALHHCWLVINVSTILIYQYKLFGFDKEGAKRISLLSISPIF